MNKRFAGPESLDEIWDDEDSSVKSWKLCRLLKLESLDCFGLQVWFLVESVSLWTHTWWSLNLAGETWPPMITTTKHDSFLANYKVSTKISFHDKSYCQQLVLNGWGTYPKKNGMKCWNTCANRLPLLASFAFCRFGFPDAIGNVFPEFCRHLASP